MHLTVPKYLAYIFRLFARLPDVRPDQPMHGPDPCLNSDITVWPWPLSVWSQKHGELIGPKPGSVPSPAAPSCCVVELLFNLKYLQSHIEGQGGSFGIQDVPQTQFKLQANTNFFTFIMHETDLCRRMTLWPWSLTFFAAKHSATWGRVLALRCLVAGWVPRFYNTLPVSRFVKIRTVAISVTW